ncbi:MAG: Xaa-Pro peptidase family protein [Corynebacterium sp.]|nr:Xaa-Pro peptidase family protein [Corynebacterium sp.]
MNTMSDFSVFSPAVYSDRIVAAQTILTQHGLTAIIVATGEDFFYYTGSELSSHERLSALVIPASGQPTVFAPFTDIADLQSSPLSAMHVAIQGWKDGDDVYGMVADTITAGVRQRKASTSLASRETTTSSHNHMRVGVTAALTADHLLRLQSVVDAQWVLANDELAEQFMVKDQAEIAELERAAAAIDSVHQRVPQLLRPGRTEREVAADLQEMILEKHIRVDFIIVGSGPNGANPHHSFSDRVLEVGDPCVIDIGGTVDSGYHSDSTRTYVVGGALENAPEDFRAAYEVLYAAQQTACEFAGPEKTAAQIDACARDILSDAGLGELFSHRLGHGIGLGMHELPSIAAGNDTPIVEGMSFSIEPGLYKEGHWGMRLEDIVVVTSSGVRSLNNAPRELR